MVTAALVLVTMALNDDQLDWLVGWLAGWLVGWLVGWSDQLEFEF